VAILTPEHLFEQADRLLTLYPRKPRQTEIRRAISAAYYGLFHFTLARASDEFVGAKYQSAPRYALAYRSISHPGLRSLCVDVAKTTAPEKLKPYMPAAGFGRDIRMFAAGLVNPQDKRHAADYDPSISFARQDAEAAISTARTAIERFQLASGAERRDFLALLLFAARGKS
jgi:hypothetical protein